MYDVIVLGATFTAAGIGKQKKKKCLILERQLRAGYEFSGALHFRHIEQDKAQTKEGATLQKRFMAEPSAPLGCDGLIYPLLQECNVLFGTELVSVEKNEEGFCCTVFGPEGFRRFSAKDVIDTRSHEEKSTSKTFNLLIESETEPDFPDLSWQQLENEQQYVLYCSLPRSETYEKARLRALETVRSFTQGQRLILLADEFDYLIDSKKVRREGGSSICLPRHILIRSLPMRRDSFGERRKRHDSSFRNCKQKAETPNEPRAFLRGTL